MVVRFDPNKHFEEMIKWLRQRDAYVPTLGEMPAIGFVAYSNSVPVAMAFLRRVEGGFGQLDGLCSNPEASGEDRNLSIDAVVDQVFIAASELNIKSLTATSVHNGTLERSLKHGFSELPHTVIVAPVQGAAARRRSE
jgi:hypothetical protein